MTSPDVEPPNRSPAGDLALVQRALGQDRLAIEALGERLRCIPAFVAAANRRMGTPLGAHELADLAQDTVVIIWQKLETFEGRATLEGWAWRIGSLELRNRIRRVARQRRVAGTSLSALEFEPPERPPQAMPFQPEELDAALQEIPAEMAEVIRLKHDDGLMFKEIGTRLDVPENTAKTRYYRGIAKMRAVLDRGQTDRNAGDRDSGSRDSDDGTSDGWDSNTTSP